MLLITSENKVAVRNDMIGIFVIGISA